MLREIVATDVFKLLLVFLRVGAAMSLFPAIGGSVVSARMRLLIALAFAFALIAPIAPALPAEPKDPWALMVMALGEILIGVYLGGITQLIVAAVDLAGSLIGYATGLTNALVSDPVTDQQSQLVTGLLTLATVTLLLLTDSEHIMLRALADSYRLFTPGQPILLGDMAQTMVETMSSSFSIGARLAAPLLVFSLMFNVTLGIINRMVPQVQVFFVGLPIQVLGGMAVLAISLPVFLLWFVTYWVDTLSRYVAPG